MSNDEILTVKETAALLKTTRQQVRKMIANEELPAFWSVGCLTHKSESFRLRFVLFTTVRSADFPLFPSSPARSNPVLGQKWVKENFTITNFEYAVYLLVYEILFFFSLSIKPVNKEETNTTVV